MNYYSKGADASTGVTAYEFKRLCDARPERKIQQIIFDMHERIYNTTGISPENGDTEEVTNMDYLNAIVSIRIDGERKDRIEHITQKSIDDEFLEDSDEWCIPEHELTPEPDQKFSINHLLDIATVLVDNAGELEANAKILEREIVAIKHQIGEEF